MKRHSFAMLALTLVFVFASSVSAAEKSEATKTTVKP